MSTKIARETTKQLRTYTKSFSSNKRFTHLFKSIQLIIGAVLAGYTAQNIPHTYMNYASHPIGQFFIYFLLFNQSHNSKTPIQWIILDALLFTLVINLILFMIKKHHESRKNKKY